MKRPQLLDQYGTPVKRSVLTKEVAAATVGGVRSPVSGYPSDDLDPVRLASILRAADQGDPTQFLELAEIIEERDPHYLGVLGTRKRSVSQIEITVKPASDSARDIEMADMITEWLDRGELVSELFHILDAIGKGYSFTEIMWDTSEGQWRPSRLEYRDPRWFQFDRHDLKTPMQLDENGQVRPLEPYKFIYAQMTAKSGLPIRSGLARVAAWGWLFKAFTARDWAIFAATFGQPLRIGKWGAGASEADKITLFNAVANIAGDCAVIIPDSMDIELVEAKNTNSSGDLYLKRVDHLDQQISKAVLGQTGTTDSVVGGLGSNKEHREVQEDIEKADAAALAAILNRDLIRPWIDLEFGPQTKYPTLVIARPEAEDLRAEAEIFSILVEAGLAIKAEQAYNRFGWEKPAEGDVVLDKSPEIAPQSQGATGDTTPDRFIKRFSDPVKRSKADQGVTIGQTALQASQGGFSAGNEIAPQTDQLQDAAAPEIGAMLAKVEAMMEDADSLEEFKSRLLAGFDDVDSAGLSAVLAQAFIPTVAGGMLSITEEDADG